MDAGAKSDVPDDESRNERQGREAVAPFPAAIAPRVSTLTHPGRRKTGLGSFCLPQFANVSADPRCSLTNELFEKLSRVYYHVRRM